MGLEELWNAMEKEIGFCQDMGTLVKIFYVSNVGTWFIQITCELA